MVELNFFELFIKLNYIDIFDILLIDYNYFFIVFKDVCVLDEVGGYLMLGRMVFLDI